MERTRYRTSGVMAIPPRRNTARSGSLTRSNGRVGLLGVSYLALSQYAVAAEQPKHLATICPWEGFSDFYRDFARPGGVREDGFIIMWDKLTGHVGRVPESIRAQ